MAFSTQQASVSIPLAAQAARRWKHDVFLSFRGVDTRKGITSLLYDELENRRIKSFKDDQELEVGMEISPSLLTAIEESRFSIVVLSPNYASSPWCLDELTKICQCMKGKDTILPLFYQVDPSDVRHQNKSFEVAFTDHEENSRQCKDKVNQWRVALKNVADLSGWESKNYKSDEELVKNIVEFMCNKVHPIEFKSTMSTESFEAFDATRKAMDELMKALKDDEVSVIGIEGMGGVGKTTMVKHVGAQAQKDGHFDHVIMAVVSQSPDLLNIQGTLSDLLRLKLHEETLIGRAGKLRDRIMRGNKILIILDDIWEEIDLSSIGIPNHMELQRCNSKFILTTRRRNVCHVMKTQAHITLHILSEKDSWALFVKHAEKSFHESTIFYNVARKVARECAGLPIALVAVSKALGDKDIEEWKLAAQRLQKSQPANLDDKGDVSKCIKLSYDYLNSGDAKSCFLLCCLFPEDKDIQIEDLMRYGFGIGLFPDDNNIEEARARVHSVAKYLKGSSLLLDSTKDGCIRMHDVVRDTAISIASSKGCLLKAGCELKDWPRIKHKGYFAISLMNNKIGKLPGKLVCSKLQILILQGNDAIKEIPDNFFRRQKALRVLDISSTCVSSLPPSLNFLVNLQTLCLNSCRNIVDISILGNLKKLEILSMRFLYLKELPKEIGYLSNLRVLDITNSLVHTIPTKVISGMSRLEELYLKYFPKSIVEALAMEEEYYISSKKLVALKYLTILQVNIPGADCLPKDIALYPNWEKFNICLCSDSSRQLNYLMLLPELFLDDYARTLTLSTTITALPDWFISVVTKKTEKLQYIECDEDVIDILVEHDCGKLQCVKYLSVSGSRNVEGLMNSTARVLPNEPVFENLQVLKVVCMELQEFCVGELPPGSLRNLTELNVFQCVGMVNGVVPPNLLQRLQNLETLICARLKESEYVFGSEGVEPEQIILTNLTKLLLVNLDELIRIWNGPVPRAIFHNLHILAVHGCPNLKSLLTSDVGQCLLQLEYLWVERCSSLKRVIVRNEETEINKVLVIPKLKDIVLISLPQLTEFYTGKATIACPSLEHLHVLDCPKFDDHEITFMNGKELSSSEKYRLSLRKRIGLTYELHRTAHASEEEEEEEEEEEDEQEEEEEQEGQEGQEEEARRLFINYFLNKQSKNAKERRRRILINSVLNKHSEGGEEGESDEEEEEEEVRRIVNWFWDVYVRDYFKEEEEEEEEDDDDDEDSSIFECLMNYFIGIYE